MGGKLSTVIWCQTSKDVTFDACGIVVQTPEDGEKYLQYEIKYVPVTTLIKSADEQNHIVAAQYCMCPMRGP